MTLQCEKCASRLDSIFCHLSGKMLQGIDAHKVTNPWKRGQILFYEGNACGGLFCIFSGKIKTFKNGTDGKEAILRLVGPGDVMGYHSLLSGKPHYCTAEVIEDATVCFIDKQFFKELIEKTPEVALQVIDKLGNEVRTSTQRISDMQNLPVRARLSNLLLSFSKIYGRPIDSGILLDIHLSRTEFASILGVAPETVMRLLGEFAEAGHLQLDGKNIIVSDSQGLLDEAGIDS